MSAMQGSSIRQEGADRRVGHLLSLMGFTVDGPEDTCTIDPVFIGFTLSACLGWRDIEERRSDILPHLPKLLAGCEDFHWTLEARDTQFSPSVAVNELLAVAEPLWHNVTHGGTTKQAPFAIAGNLFSSITSQVTARASTMAIVQASGTATSMALESSELFTRTIPTNAQDARAVMTYYASIGVDRVASICINGPYGIQFNKAIQDETHALGISLVFFLVERENVDELLMKALKESQARHVFAMVLEGEVKSAHKHEVIGHPDYRWMVPDLACLLDPGFGLGTWQRDGSRCCNAAMAFHGLGMINLHMVSDGQEMFNRAFTQLSHDPVQQQDIIAKTPYPQHFSNFSFYDVFPPFLCHFPVCESVIAMGLAACNTPGLFTGPELFEQLLQTSFEGLSGTVSFNNKTGTRNARGSGSESNLIISYHQFVGHRRNTESFGRCECPNNWVFLFAGGACVAKFCGAIFASYVCYKVRNVTIYFSETHYLSVSIACLMETAFIGGPMLLAARDNPSAFFWVSAALTCVTCLVFLLLIFAFKIFKKDSTFNIEMRKLMETKEKVGIRLAFHCIPGLENPATEIMEKWAFADMTPPCQILPHLNSSATGQLEHPFTADHPITVAAQYTKDKIITI